jgi:thiopurine S-methyltransferase
MDTNFWIERWEQEQIGFHQPGVNAWLQKHWRDIGVTAGSVVFVPLCGKSLDMVWLRERGHTIIGIELSRRAVRDFFAGLQLEPRIAAEARFEVWEAPGYRLLCGDYFALQASDLDGVCGVFDRAALNAFPPEMRARYVAKLREVVPPQAYTLLVTMTYPQPQMSGPPFSVSEAEVRQLYGGFYHVDKLQDQDVLALAENVRFRERGMGEMSEQVYRISSG